MTRVLHWIVPLSFAILLTGVGFLLDYAEDEQPLVEPIVVRIPELSASARAGAMLFATYCAACHGRDASGSSAGPPLIHTLYRAALHADAIIRMAVKTGVGQHHWRFGDMPPIAAVGEPDVEAIVAYVRELQRANGFD